MACCEGVAAAGDLAALLRRGVLLGAVVYTEPGSSACPAIGRDTPAATEAALLRDFLLPREVLPFLPVLEAAGASASWPLKSVTAGRGTSPGSSALTSSALLWPATAATAGSTGGLRSARLLGSRRRGGEVQCERTKDRLSSSNSRYWMHMLCASAEVTDALRANSYNLHVSAKFARAPHRPRTCTVSALGLVRPLALELCGEKERVPMRKC